MPVIGDDFVFRVRFTCLTGSDVAQNIYYYRQDPAAFPLNAADVGAAVASALQPSQRALMSITADFVRIETDQLASLENFSDIPQTGVGGFQVGQVLPSFVACPITLFRTTKETRNGSKRLAFFTEDNLSGDFWDVDIQDEIDDIAAAMAAPIGVSSFTIRPVIVGGLYDTDVNPPALKPEDEWIYNPVAGAGSSYRATSQNSRKLGRGI